MSRSPTTSLARSVVSEDYQDAEVRLYQLVKAGYSFSGHERNCAFLNMGNGRFANVSAITGFDFPDDGRAMALVDWDLDGDLDVWLANRTAPRVRFLRNDAPSDNRYLAVRLEGRTCNRDAIGARVEVTLADPPGPKLMRTLRAGEGFLGQSSKWLHFGVGRARRVKRLAVHWPGGGVEEFSDLETGHHYRIVQGSRKARPWSRSPRKVTLARSKSKVPDSRERFRSFLTARLPLPPLTYRTFQEEERRLETLEGAPLLLNLWASWCRPCAEELAELTRRREKLREVGLQVLALSVDSIGPASPPESSTTEAAEKRLQELGFPFRAGKATSEFVDQLQAVHNLLFKPHRPLPVPTSFLIDSAGQLAAIYKGPVEVDQLVADVDMLSLKDGSLLQAALPFRGRWYWPPDKPRLLPLAAELLDQQSIDAAIAFTTRYSNEISRDPGYPELLYRLGREFLQREQPGAAEAYFRQALALEPDNPNGHYNLGIALTELGHVDDAIASYQKTLQLDPVHTRAHNNLGNLLRDTGNLTRAIEHYRQALTLNTDLVEIHLNLGNLLLSLGQLDEARTHFENILRLQPNHAQAHNNLGFVLATRHEPDPAIQHYRRALQLDANYAQAHNNLASALAARGSIQEATEHLQQAVAIDPKFADAFKNLGRLLQGRGKSHEAAEPLQTALELRPDDPETHSLLAISFLTQGDAAAAVRYAREAVRLNPIDGRACVRLGEILSRQGERAEATDWFRQALELNPDDLLAHNRLGLSLASAGETEEAIHHLRQALRGQPQSAQCLSALAWLLATTGRDELRRPDEAVQLAEQVAELTKRQDPQALETLAAAYAAAGRFTEAMGTQQRAIQLAEAAEARPVRIENMGKRLRLYEQSKPYVDEAR